MLEQINLHHGANCLLHLPGNRTAQTDLSFPAETVR
jgi:hypothetical protein